MIERKQETKLVKDALCEAGYKNISVRHATGTAWGWLEIRVGNTLPGMDSNRRHIIGITQRVTGRHGEYDGCINVN